MKKVLLTALFAASAAIGFSSCMNGDYDATPTSDNGTPNPLVTHRAAVPSANNADSLGNVKAAASAIEVKGR